MSLHLYFAKRWIKLLNVNISVNKERNNKQHDNFTSITRISLLNYMCAISYICCNELCRTRWIEKFYKTQKYDILSSSFIMPLPSLRKKRYVGLTVFRPYGFRSVIRERSGLNSLILKKRLVMTCMMPLFFRSLCQKSRSHRPSLYNSCRSITSERSGICSRNMVQKFGITNKCPYGHNDL